MRHRSRRQLGKTSERPRDQLQAEARKVGCCLGSIGDYERLAGVNTLSAAERQALWWQFQAMFTGPTQELFDAVVDHCSEIALAAIREGRLCLLGNTWGVTRHAN